MSRHSSFQFRGEREGRVAQMSRQEEVIARKRQELLEKKRTNELAKQVVAAQTAVSETTELTTETIADVVKHPSNLPQQTFVPDPPAAKNNFTNDGSFFENFRRITEAAKKAEEERQKVEAERLAKEKELEQQLQQQQVEIENAEKMIPPMPIPSMDSAFSTNSMAIGGPQPPPIKDPNLFAQNIPSFINLTPPPPPPPPPAVIEPSYNIPQINHLPPPQPPPLMQAAPPFLGGGPPNIQPGPGLGPAPAPFLCGGPNIQQSPMQPPLIQPPFEGNNYLNETQMNRNCGNIEQMDENPRQTRSLPTLNTEQMNTITTANIAAAKSTIPTTIDGLIEFIAKNGDDYEEKIITEIAQMNERTLFRFLSEKDSENYKMYRNKVNNYRVAKLGQAAIDNSEKYDPEDILRDDENEIDNSVPQIMLSQPQSQSIEDSDEYDSDSEYMQETMERNLENMKRRIDSGNTKKRYAEETTSYSSDGDHTDEEDHMEMYRKIQMRENSFDQDAAESLSQQELSFERMQNLRTKAKRSRWGDKVETKLPQPEQPQQQQQQQQQPPPIAPVPSQPVLSGVKRTDPALLNYARQNYGTIDLTEDDWQKCEEHYKVNLLYQDMLRKRDELDRLAKSGRHKYEYDSDEDTTGGTWEHKMRNAEMDATAAWADALNKQSEGKHHIGDFLPPEELKKFMEIYKSKQTNREPDLSDYKEYKLKEDNKGFQMLQKLGWTEGKGLGIDGSGIINPINKATQRDSNQGLGTTSSATPEAGDNEYEAYRKRMMLAYRFRPNPLNNPRRAYY